MRFIFIIIVFFLLSVSISANYSQHPQLNKAITQLIFPADGKIGFCAHHIERNLTYCFNGDEFFPMGSIVKIPLAFKILSLIEEKQLTLQKMIEIKNSDLRPGWSFITEMVGNEGLILSVLNLLDLSIVISDNTAADKLYELAGGPQKVNQKLIQFKIPGIQIDRTILEMILDSCNIKKLPENFQYSQDNFINFFNCLPPEKIKSANLAFNKIPKDIATPYGMSYLLQQIYLKKILNPEHSELLINLMQKCKTGENRIKAYLPKTAILAHKTGTISGSTNDIGIITLPDHHGNIILTVFIKDSKVEIHERSRLISDIARTVYDFFMLNE